jgi:hypothetical protein
MAIAMFAQPNRTQAISCTVLIMETGGASDLVNRFAQLTLDTPVTRARVLHCLRRRQIRVSGVGRYP